MKRSITILFSMATLWVAMSFSKKPVLGNIYITLDHFVGDIPMMLDTVTYKNALGQPFTVTKFRYYIGEISLYNNKREQVMYKRYFLVDEDERESKKIDLLVPDEEYTTISFTIGVDSASNCSGAQSGDLDPVHGMFWAWNTGYIFMKLEGKSPVSASPGHIFEFHIGGYKQPANCIRKVTLALNQPLNIQANNQLHLKVDASEVLKTPTDIDLSKLSSVTDFHNATTIADNYSDMFSVNSQPAR